MTIKKTTLTSQEKKWILEQRITRLTDQKEVLIYPMGAERYLSSVLFKNKPNRYNIRADIQGKNVLIIPGYGNSAFLFAQAGAKSITVYDKDPVTITWVKAYKKYYHFRGSDKQYPSVGEVLTALTRWYPPLVLLPAEKFKNVVSWMLHPQLLRQTLIYYMMSLVQEALRSNSRKNFELDKDIQFYAGEIHNFSHEKQVFDTAFVPYLLGVHNGIEHEKDIVQFIKQLTQLVPAGRILITPAQNTKEFYLTGQRYFTTTVYSSIQEFPDLKPWFVEADTGWFKTQGLALFGVQD